MRAEYKRDMNHNYLVLHGEEELDTASYQVRMLVANVIPSLLKCRFHGVDGKTLLYYEITSKQSLATLYEQKLLDGKDLQLILGSFIQVVEQMTEYLLNPEQILLQPEYIYMDVEKKELFFCYLPGEKREIKKQLQMLTEYILPKINHSDEYAVMLGYGVYRRALEEDFHLEHVKEELFQQRETGEERQKIQKKPDRLEKANNFSDERQIGDFPKKEGELEALFQENNLKQKSGEHKEKLAIRKHKKEKNRKKQDKIYILIPVIGTVLIMAILAANMMGILPWLEVEILLFFVVLVSMLFSVFVYLIGGKKKKKEQAAQDLRWKKKVNISERKNTEEEQKWSQKDNKFQESMQMPEDDFTQRTAKAENPIKSNLGKKEYSQENYGETIVLCESAVRGPASLVSKEPGELATIFLKEELTVIGKLEHAADAVIPLPTVSRLHAKIRKRENEYYLADLNSRNGTSVNGKMLKADEEYLLQDEDEIDFAQARYIFLK